MDTSESLTYLFKCGGFLIKYHIRYGADAAQSASMMTGTAKNIGLVYIDMRGVGRKAIVKRVTKEYVKNHARSSKSDDGYVAPVAGSLEKK